MTADLNTAKDPGKEPTKDALLRAAKKVFATKGYDGATVKEVADEAGVNVSLVSYHFHGKENLFRACIEAYGADRLSATERFLKTPQSVEDFRARITIYLDDYLQTALREPDTMMIMHRECIGQNELIRDLFEKFFLKSVQNLMRFFGEASERGFLRQGVDPHYAVMILMGALIHSIQMNPMHEELFKIGLKDQSHRDKIVQSLVLMLLGQEHRP
jgi:AcrR family transcriptional regulator